MASTSAMESADTISQQEDFVFNFSHYFDNITTFSDYLDWDSWQAELGSNPVFKAALWIQNYYAYILSAIGVPCNILSFLVLRRIKPLASALLIMMTLSVVDSLNLMVMVSDNVFRSSRVDLSYTNIGCCVMKTAIYFLQYMPIWLVVLLTLERVIAVCFPIKAAQVCTIPNACRSFVILCVVDVILCTVHMFIYEERRTGAGFICLPKSNYVTFYLHWLKADTVFFVFIPLILIFVSNMAIIVKLRMPTGMNNETVGPSTSEENKRQNRSITLMLLAVSMTTLICLGPNLFLGVTGGDWDVVVNVSPGTFARRQIAIVLIMFLTNANNAVNFFLYVLTGRRFRAEFNDMVTSRFGIPKLVGYRSTTSR